MSLIELDSSYRSRTPEETLEVIKPYIKQAGITRLADLTGLDHIGIPVYAAVRPLAKSISISQGKGLCKAQAKCSAAMESIEVHWAEELKPAILQLSEQELLKLKKNSFLQTY